jgi:hypothetical protein
VNVFATAHTFVMSTEHMMPGIYQAIEMLGRLFVRGLVRLVDFYGI